MGKKHDSHSHHSHHKHDWFGDHHHHHHHHGDHHHGGRGFLVGTRGDDVLEGTAKNDVIIGRKGDDALYGRDGNDWLFGDKGKDLLDGGAGSDKVFGGKGNDVAVYSLAENAGVDACGKPTHDYYDGGKGGCDVLQLILTPEEMKSDAVMADIAAYEAFLADHGGHGKVFEFTSFELTVRNFEALEVIGGNSPPEANADAYTTNEDTELVVHANPVNKGILSNDTDADGDSLSAVLVDEPQHGALVINDDGSFTYMPDEDYFGSDSFTYKATDGEDESDVTEVALEVVAVNDPPIIVPNWTVNADQTSTLLILPGPANESDQVLTIFLGAPEHGTASVTDTNTIAYTPNPGYVGDDVLPYGIIDDNGEPGYFEFDTLPIDVIA